MPTRHLDLSRDQIVAFRRRAGGLDRRRPLDPGSLRAAAWAGLQDSVPRAALLSIHARVDGTAPTTWEDPPFVQVWGPRFSAYVVDEQDRGIFTLGRLPDDPAAQEQANEMADRLEAFLDGRPMSYADAGRALGHHPNLLRRAACTGRVLMRWEGSRRPTIWMVPAPDLDPVEARRQLALRYLHVFGPGTAAAFSEWAGIKPRRAQAAFDALAPVLTPVRTPIGDASILTEDEKAFRTAPDGDAAPVRLLPSGDTFFLLQGTERELLVPDAARRSELWTTRVWPGAVVLDGEVAGTWRRAGAVVKVQVWRRPTPAARQAIELEARSFPLPDLEGRLRVEWEA
jgi:hypothetical protein